MIRSSINEWKKTPWRNIDIEQMDIECKKFAKDIRSLDKEMKNWDSYIHLETTVRNLLTALRAVSDLQNPAIRERHWQQLMQATGVEIRGFRNYQVISIETLDHFNFFFKG